MHKTLVKEKEFILSNSNSFLPDTKKVVRFKFALNTKVLVEMID
jgi:hypothetical protein